MRSLENILSVLAMVGAACLIAAGLTECAKELRHEIPISTMIRLEVLRNAIA